MQLTFELRDRASIVLARGQVEVIAGPDCQLYATSNGQGEVIQSGDAVMSVVLLSPLVHVGARLPETIRVKAGDTVTLLWEGQVVARVEGSVVDPLDGVDG